MNRLADEQSLYLRQHADNPVDWYPWGEEALNRAREEGKPILLSIGYSACHWCHVMAHESFEDPDVAAVMNEHFVNIKVDREERPDLDKIYQLAHQALAQRPGGWPLTMFLEPREHTPFYGGTYFPPEPRHGLPGFAGLLQRVADFFGRSGGDLERQNQAMQRFLTEMSQVLPGDVPELDPVRLGVARLAEQFDADYGGFGGAPKFPHPPNLELLLSALTEVQDRTGNELLAMVDRTLEAMARGGLFDQVGGGFFRYCVDASWTIPHFEKMLYDNALLLPLYGRRGAERDDPLFIATAERTVDWLRREMVTPAGTFHASLDADSEGEEGRYYVWNAEQLEEVLRDDDKPLATAAWGLDDSPNFEGRAWHLVRRRPIGEIAEQLSMEFEATKDRLEGLRERLLAQRQTRVPPARDDKQLTAWNALMIRGLALAGRWLDRPEWVDLAFDAWRGLIDGAYEHGRLKAVLGSELPGYLDDHVYLLAAGLALVQARWDDQVLEVMTATADTLLDRFEDREDGGFFFTADDHEQLVQRPRSFNDESTPSGNGLAALALTRLGHLLGEARYLDAAERVLRASGTFLERAPHACPTLLRALIAWHDPPRLVIVRGELDKPLAAGHLDAYHIPASSRLADRYPLEGNFTAYLCEGRRCGPPIPDLPSLAQALAGDD